MTFMLKLQHLANTPYTPFGLLQFGALKMDIGDNMIALSHSTYEIP